VVLDGYAGSCFIVDSPSAVIVVQMAEGKDTPTLLQGKGGAPMQRQTKFSILLLASIAGLLLFTMQPSYGAQDKTAPENTTQGTTQGTTDGPVPNGKEDEAGFPLPGGILRSFDQTLNASLAGTMAGLTLAAAAFLLTILSSVEERIERNEAEADATRKSTLMEEHEKAPVLARAGERNASLENQANEAKAATKYALYAFGWFILGLLVTLAFDPTVASIADNLRSELLAVTDVAATGVPMVFGIRDLGRSAIRILDIADTSPSVSSISSEEHKGVTESEQPPQLEAGGETREQDGESVPERRTSNAQPPVVVQEQTSWIRRSLRTFLK
jgi:hypothetical protein